MLQGDKQALPDSFSFLYLNVQLFVYSNILCVRVCVCVC